jgi:hypothetical protein
MLLSNDAHKALSSILKFAGIHKQTDYISVFYNENRRELALERERSEAIFVWLEKYETSIPGVSIKNQQFPGQPYDWKQTRNSNLNDKNSPNLKIGNKAWYLEVESLDALLELARWYARR